MLYKKVHKSKAKELTHIDRVKKFGLALSIFRLQVQNAHSIENLAELFDKVTEYVFDALNTTNAMTEQLILVINQHTDVLDYLTASQGGMCQIVGPACCHYVDSSGSLQVKHDLEQAKRLKKEFRKAHYEEDSQWPEWLGWLNPANWFSGLGRWVSGILHTALYVLLISIIYMWL